MIRVLIADDSPTARSFLVKILAGDREVEVVGEARDGLEAVELTRKLRPSLVTMDVEMPGMSGLEAIGEIMAEAPTPIVVVTAGNEAGEVGVSMEALRAGALCVLRKPSGPQSPSHAREARQLVESVKSMSQVKVVRRVRKQVQPPRPAPAPAPTPVAGARAIAVAASTGGPAALARVLSDLPGDFPAPVLVAQHISRGFTDGLATWLGTHSRPQVRVAQAGEMLAAGTVYVAPEDRHLAVSDRGAVVLSSAPPVGGFRPSATYLFESVAQAFGAAVVAVVLTGMGEDGVAGLHAVRKAGGRVLVQDERTCTVFGMPGAAIAAGLADDVVPLDDLASAIIALSRGLPCVAR